LERDRADAFATVFYERLFSLSPAIAALFGRTDMVTMRQMLMRMISVTVRGLHNLTTVLPEIRNLGLRYYGYGVRAEHFDTAEAALLHALETQLGEVFRPEVQASWREVFDLIRRTMMGVAD
jgi:hemoglobin-like flavoprotein